MDVLHGKARDRTLDLTIGMDVPLAKGALYFLPHDQIVG
jgi:hypothetical protein